VRRILLPLYLVVLARYTLWPESSQRATWKRINAVTAAASSGRVDAHHAEMLANVALFVPFGMLGLVLFQRAILIVVASAALSSAIELAQHWWLPSRDGTVRDVALNVVGAVFGWVGARAIARLALTVRRWRVGSHANR
jgi:glycopeptide antibiotics resistance protein